MTRNNVNAITDKSNSVNGVTVLRDLNHLMRLLVFFDILKGL